MPHRPLLRALSLLGTLSLAIARPSPAQDSRPVCWHWSPGPACGMTVLTDFGLYFTGGSRPESVLAPAGNIIVNSRFTTAGRVTGDWGLLFNVGQRDALGASMLGSVELGSTSSGFDLSAYARYRRALGGKRSLDLGLGVPIARSGYDEHAGPRGLVKYNLSGLVGVALRPELRRFSVYDGVLRRQSRFYLSAGAEIGQKPGFAVSGILGAAFGVLAYLFRNID